MNEEKTFSTMQKNIIKATLQLVSHAGCKSTTTKQIATHAGINESTIFKNFKSKNELFRIAFELQLIEMKQEVDEFFGQRFDSPRVFLTETGTFLLHMFESHKDAVITSIKEIGNEQAKLVIPDSQEYVLEMFVKKINEMKQEKIIENVDADTTAFLFTNAILGLLMREAKNEYEEQPKPSAVTIDSVIHSFIILLDHSSP